jgi:hypothetical protein
MIRKPSDNKCSGSQHHLQEEEEHVSPSKTFTDMLIVFFHFEGIVMVEWVPSGQTVSQQYYIEVLPKLRERVRRKRPEL